MTKQANLIPVEDTTVNTNLNRLNTKFDNTLSLDGSTPNAMNADLDMNDNDILNAKSISTDELYVAGEDVSSLSQYAQEAAQSAQEAEDSATSAEESAQEAALYDGPKFDTIALMAAYTNAEDGDTIVVWNGFNSEPETFTYDADSTLTADGALVVDATGMGAGRFISTRTTFATVADMLADVRTGFAVGTRFDAAGFSYDVVSSGEHLTTAGGVKLEVLPGSHGKVSVEAFGCKLDGVSDDTVAFQAALDSGMGTTSGRGTLKLTDTILLDPGSSYEGAGGVAVYNDSATKIHFEPDTKRDIFTWRTAPSGYVFDGVTLKGFTIRGFGPGAGACLDLPLLYGGDLHFYAYAGIDAFARIEKWMDTKFSGGCQGFRTFGVEFYNSSGSSSDVTTTSTFDLYISQGPKGYVMQNYSVSGINIKGVVESVDTVLEQYRGNVVKMDIYTENAPRTDAGAAFIVGKSGTAPANATSLILNLNPGIGFSTGATPAVCKLIDIDHARFVKISGYAYLYGVLMATTVNTQRVVLDGLDTDNCPWLSFTGGIYDMNAIDAFGFRPRAMQTQGDAFFSEYHIAGPNLELFPLDRASITRRKMALDKWTGKLVRRDAYNNLSQPIGYLETTVRSGWTFNGARLMPGEFVVHNSELQGDVSLWVSQRHTKDTATSVASCSTTSGSAVISKSAGAFSNIAVNDWVTVSAGYGSATFQRRVVSKAADDSSITLDTNATSTTSTATVATEAHALLPAAVRGYRQAAIAPGGVVTPYFVGQEYYDTAGGNWYKSTGLTTADWALIS